MLYKTLVVWFFFFNTLISLLTIVLTLSSLFLRNFRNALRHLVHIDLYDNFGLAHNVFGRHNSCYCYITATPAYREMVASPFATEVLNRFGISSASVKLVGNRNPYSQINAIFNALSKHENIDEIAKDRGKRYLSVRWAHDRNL